MRRFPWTLTLPDVDALLSVGQEFAQMQASGILDRHVQEAMDGLASIESGLEAARTLRDQFDIVTLPDTIAKLQPTLSTATTVQQTGRVLIDTESTIAKYVATIAKTAATFGESYEKMRRSLVATAEAARFLPPTPDLADFSKAHDALLDAFLVGTAYIDGLGEDAITVDEDGELRVESEAIDRDDLKAALSDASVDSTEELTPDALGALVREAVRQAQKQPVYVVVLHLLLTIVVGILSNLATDEVKKLRPDHRVVQRQVNQAARQLHADPQILKTLRVVLKPDLPVYRKSRKKSGRTARLRVGEVVSLVHRKRNWALVEWTHDDSHRYGWVFARYLGRIEPDRLVPGRRTHPPEWSCD